MEQIKKGSVVRLKNDNNDVAYLVSNIIKNKRNKLLAELKGITFRIEIIKDVDELQLIGIEQLNDILEKFDKIINLEANKVIERVKEEEVNNMYTRKVQKSISGKILHLDGDKQYAMKSAKIYSKMGLNAIVKNIKESRQPYEIKDLLNQYNPDILIITGHDGMIRKGYNYNDIRNYRNSKYFINTVLETRKWEQGTNSIAIFAGACQSYYEAIIEAGANFASSPARILIDFMDPLIIARKVAITSSYHYITINDIRDDLKNGERGVSGVGSYGKFY